MALTIGAEHELLEYCGRIDDRDKTAPLFLYPASYVRMRFRGAYLAASIAGKRQYWDNYLGIWLDGRELKIKIEDKEWEPQRFVLAEELEDGVHEVMLFKRQDGCHVFRFLGFELNEEGVVLELPPPCGKRIEVYGDSVSAGEVSEAEEFAGLPDPEWHQGEYSNSYYSYAWICARRLGASLHCVAQGGIALLDRSGWYDPPFYKGMESVYDKVNYNPFFGEVSFWDFERYRPQVVVVALGQNDSHPTDYMAHDPKGEQARAWEKGYEAFVRRLRELYPGAVIILMTTILEHDRAWDEAIGRVWKRLEDDRVFHFLFSQNGRGTPGHIRRSEAETMAKELESFIESLGEEVWTREN